MINQRLFDQYNIDTKKDLKIKNLCPRPKDTILIDKQGSCYACECTAWLPQSIGNLQVKSLSEIIGSETHTQLQDSISDGSYRYCNENQCPYIKSGNVLNTIQDTLIKEIRLAIDDSCNLRCPSCRNGMIFHKEGLTYNKRIKLADSINHWLELQEHPLTVHMGSDGDPFASNIYRYFMSNTPIKTNIGYSILTNGLMFEEHRGVLANIMGKLKVLGVSIDGASKQTYEKLRLGGRWDKIKSNLQSMADSKDKYDFWFRFHVVVQQDNWWEMKDMVELAESYGVDEIYFSKIQDWNTALDHSKQTFTNLKEFKDLRDEVTNMSTKYIVAGF
jgi:sulfatase maturation enzyme AslB (radical SAM superfamily)